MDKRGPRTVESYESHVRLHIVPEIGHYWIADIRPAHIRNLYRHLSEDLKTIQELARHGSIHVTMDTYAHVMPAAKRAAASKMDGIVRGETNVG